MSTWGAGDELTAARLNTLQGSIPAAPRVGPGLLASGDANGMQRVALGDLQLPRGYDTVMRRMKVSANHDDYLECYLQNGDGTSLASATVNVAKPKALRGAGDTSYSAGAEIVAFCPVYGGTGVTVSGLPLVWEALAAGAGSGGGGGGGDVFYPAATAGSLAVVGTNAWQDTTIGFGSARAYLIGVTADLYLGTYVDFSTYSALEPEVPLYLRLAWSGLTSWSAVAVVPHSGLAGGLGYILHRTDAVGGLINYTCLGYWAPAL